MTLYSSVIRLHALAAGNVPQTQGHLAHAAFLDIVRQVDPDMSAALHNAQTRQPFTVSPLHGLPRASGESFVRPGHECWLRVTLASETLFGTFIRRFLQGDARPTIRLGLVTFGVSEVLTTPGSHPWAGYTTAEELMAGARDDATIALEFASPFAFSLGGGRAEIMPRPELLFDSLQRKWEQWCTLPLPATLERDWLRESVLVSEWRMRSRMLRLGSRLQLGSEGVALYRVFGGSAALCKTLHTLASFAFYAGVGYKTTMGMGQVRRLERWSPAPSDEDADELPA